MIGYENLLNWSYFCVNLTESDEKKLWDRGIIGLDTPQSLLNAVFYYNGRNFGLRGIRERHNLCFSQIVGLTNPDRYQYIEHGSKNNAGGIDVFKLDVKNVTVTAMKDSMQCHVRILDTYLSHLPNDIPLNSQFYLRPLEYIGSYVSYSNLHADSSVVYG